METPLTQGKMAQIDPEDWPLVAPFSWHAKLEIGVRCYAATTVNERGVNRALKMYDLTMGIGPGEMVDHRDNEAMLDNRRANLRLRSNAQNQQNTSGWGGSSRFKGVSWSSRKRSWLVAFRCEGTYQFVGYFDDKEVAARAYDAAILPLAGKSNCRRSGVECKGGRIAANHHSSDKRPSLDTDGSIRRCRTPPMLV